MPSSNVKMLLSTSGCDWLRKDTEQFAVLGLGPHAAELLFVAAEAPRVMTDLLWCHTTVPVQHLEGNVWVDLCVEPGTLELCHTAWRRREDNNIAKNIDGGPLLCIYEGLLLFTLCEVHSQQPIHQHTDIKWSCLCVLFTMTCFCVKAQTLIWSQNS